MWPAAKLLERICLALAPVAILAALLACLVFFGWKLVTTRPVVRSQRRVVAACMGGAVRMNHE